MPPQRGYVLKAAHVDKRVKRLLEHSYFGLAAGERAQHNDSLIPKSPLERLFVSHHELERPGRRSPLSSALRHIS